METKKTNDERIVKKCIVIDRFLSMLIMPGMFSAFLIPIFLYKDAPDAVPLMVAGILSLLITESMMVYVLFMPDKNYSFNVRTWDRSGLSSITGIWIGCLFFSCWCVFVYEMLRTPLQKLELLLGFFLFVCLIGFGVVVGTFLWYHIKTFLLHITERVIAGHGSNCTLYGHHNRGTNKMQIDNELKNRIQELEEKTNK